MPHPSKDFLRAVSYTHLLLFYNKKREQVYLILREPSLLHMFTDYVESMDESHYYSLEESQKILEDVLKQYEEAWA